MKNNLVLRYPIGWTGSNPDLRNVRVLSPEIPWSKFINDTVMRGIDWLKGEFKPRIEFHNPFGTVAKRPTMRCTQYQDAVKAQLEWLYEGFYSECKKLIDNGAEVISYIGSPSTDPYYKKYLAGLSDVNSQDNSLVELHESHKVSLNSGC